ncbi:MAG: hypothetical protein LBS28_01675 [Streptococcaceae bacterium]|jgi:hypothetical protein|nr:hypothetical protein [Streptococcaceae bacterium]
MSIQERWKNIFLSLFRHGDISAEGMHHLLGFELIRLNGVVPLVIAPAPLRGVTSTFVPSLLALSPVSRPTSIISTPKRSVLSPTWSMSSVLTIPLDNTSFDVFKGYNPNDGMHHYTMNRGEVDALVSLGWRDEGVAYRCSADDMLVFRLYNPNSGIHHFTMNANEKDALVAVGWQYEDIAWYAKISGTASVFRIYNPGNGEHAWTINYVEVENAVVHGWDYEGIAWYIE